MADDEDGAGGFVSLEVLVLGEGHRPTRLDDDGVAGPHVSQLYSGIE